MSYRPEDIDLKVLKFDQIPVGYEAKITHLITQEDVDAFAALTGDFNPLHVDQDFARQTLFQKPVVHGMLSASFISTLIGTALPGSGALWSSQMLEFNKPAYVGDQVSVISKVIQKSPATQSLVLDTRILNQHGDVLISGKSIVKLLQAIGEQAGITNPITSKDELQNAIKPEALPISSSRADEDSRRIVLVTGASRGIGFAIGVRLAQQGFRVVFNSRHGSKDLTNAIKNLNSQGSSSIELRADVASFEEMQTLYSKVQALWGPITNVVHCAAPNPQPTSFDASSWEAFEDQMSIQLRGAFNCAKISLPGMLDKQSGSFVWIGSIFAEGLPPTQQSAYIAAKAAITAFGRSLAVEYGPKGIRSNIVAPGMTQTEMLSSIPDKTKMLAKMNTPLRKLATVDEIAQVVEFLLGPGSSHMTGETIRVCGGIAM